MKFSLTTITLLLAAIASASPTAFEDDSFLEPDFNALEERGSNAGKFSITTYSDSGCHVGPDKRTHNPGTVLCDKVGPNGRRSFKITGNGCGEGIEALFHSRVLGAEGCATKPYATRVYNQQNECFTVPKGAKAIGFQCA